MSSGKAVSASFSAGIIQDLFVGISVHFVSFGAGSLMVAG
jgi:hypothetical protein